MRSSAVWSILVLTWGTFCLVPTSKADDSGAGGELVVPDKKPERLMEECKARGKDLPPDAPLRVGVKERGECEGNKQMFSPFLTKSAKFNYVAFFYKNCSVFDAYHEEEGDELEIVFESSNPPYMIKGFLQGIRGMCKGEVRRITVPSKLGYGKFGAAYIPGNATLVYEVELKEVKENSKEGAVAAGFRQYP